MALKMKEEKKEALKKAAIEGAAAETVQRYGSAAKEYLVALEGVDNETGKVYKRSLKFVSKSKVNPEYEKQNLKQQAGFSAEILDVADQNAENIINKNPNRKTRTDDIPTTTAPKTGLPIGGTNDELFDHVELDANGNIIPGSAAQMKFVGNSAEQCLDKLTSNKYQKYLDADAKLEVPKDYYDKIITEADNRISDLEKQIKKLKDLGKDDVAQQKQQQIKKLKKIKKNLKKSSVSNKDAMNARKHPKLETGKRIAKISHKAGLQQGAISAGISGSIALVQNIVDVINGDKEPEDAAKDVAAKTGTGFVAGYTNAFAGTTIKALMQNSEDQFVRTLSKTNLAGTLVTTATDCTKILTKFFRQEIDGVECLEELGSSGTNMLSSAFFGAIGQAVIPLPVVGGIIGSCIGCAISSACYDTVVTSLKEAKLSHEERIRIEKECAELIKMILEYRAHAQKLISEYMTENTKVFDKGFSKMAKATKTKNINKFIEGNVEIQKQLGYKPLFNNFDEFDQLMKSKDTITL